MRSRPWSRVMLSSVLAVAVMAGCVETAIAQSPTAMMKESVRPVDAMPQLHLSLRLQVQAMELVTNDPTREASLEAGKLCRSAYGFQRGAAQGLGVDPIRRKSPLVAEAQKHITTSRENLLMCGFRFENGLINEGLEFLRKSLTATRIAVTLAE